MGSKWEEYRHKQREPGSRALDWVARQTPITISIIALFVAVYQGHVASATLDQVSRATDAQLKQFELQYRPWLASDSVEPPRLDGSPDDVIMFHLHNVGTLPAYGTTVNCVRNLPASEKHPTMKEICPKPSEGNPLAVAPGETAYQRVSIKTSAGSKAEFDKFLAPVLSGVEVLYVCVRVDYSGPEREGSPYVYPGCVKRLLDGHWAQYVPPKVDGEAP